MPFVIDLEELVQTVTLVRVEVEPEDPVEGSVEEPRLRHLSEHLNRVHLAEDPLGARL